MSKQIVSAADSSVSNKLRDLHDVLGFWDVDRDTDFPDVCYLAVDGEYAADIRTGHGRTLYRAMAMRDALPDIIAVIAAAEQLVSNYPAHRLHGLHDALAALNARLNGGAA